MDVFIFLREDEGSFGSKVRLKNYVGNNIILTSNDKNE